MAEALVAAGDRAFVDEDYEEAVKQYTQALQAAPSASVYAARAQAYIKLESYLEAAQDAAKAVQLDPSNPKALLRKGVAAFHLEEYETALNAFERGAALAPGNAELARWIRKCQAEIEGEAQAPRPAAATTAAAPPAAAAAAAVAASAAPTAPPSAAEAATTSAPPPSEPPAAAPAHAGPSSSTPAAQDGGQALAPAAPTGFAGKYRHQWYQIQDKVVVDVYAKALPRERVAVEFSTTQLRIMVRDECGAPEYELLVPRLAGEVVPERCRWEALRTKLEVTLAKAQPGLAWSSLEGGDAAVAAPPGVAASLNAPTEASAGPLRGYPSSAARGPKDWSKVEGEIKDLESKGELDDGDPLSAFFKKIFAQGDDDQRRAMMKSFVESNGTVLSTNWDEVGNKPVECTPPEGMELHKWSES